jgi:hypothetical protein
MESRSSLPSSQQPTACPYPEPHEPSTRPTIMSVRTVLILSFHRHLRRASSLYLQFSPPKPFVQSSPHTCYMSRPSLRVYPVTWRNDRETQKSLSSSLCSFLQFPLTSPLLGRNNFLGARFSNSACVLLLMWETRFHIHTKQQPIYSSIYFSVYIFYIETVVHNRL